MQTFWASLKEDLSLTDRLMLLCAVTLSLWGVFCIYSAAAGTAGRGFDYAFRQAAWLFVSVISMLIIMIVGHHKLLEGAYYLFGLSLLLLFLTLLAPKVKGAQSWLGFGGVRFQPSEFAKVAIILTMSKFLSRYPPLDFKTFIMGLGVIMIPVLLVLLQPDAGSAIVFLVISFGMLIAAGTPMKYLGGLMGLGLSAIPFMYFFLLKDYQRNRILVFIDPMRDPLGAGYNVIQSRIAVGSGGFSGKGFMMGTQSKLKFLPEPHTDFIFSVFSEEFGFVGVMVLIALFTVLLFRVILAGIRSRERRCKILVAGVSSWLCFQMFESIGMSIGIMPVTGLPLPFLSYGGSSLLSTFMALGLVASIYIEGGNSRHVF
ncbi:MAG: rod shape-determining protein RodA [Synergistaceae bacterium]|nr:rod shape-determining protein RodA [Synergistaceae bacterium]